MVEWFKSPSDCGTGRGLKLTLFLANLTSSPLRTVSLEDVSPRGRGCQMQRRPRGHQPLLQQAGCEPTGKGNWATPRLVRSGGRVESGLRLRIIRFLMKSQTFRDLWGDGW